MTNIDNLPAGPEMDALIGEALGLQVLGIVNCVPGYECGGYNIPYDTEGTIPRPVYLRECACEFREPKDIDYFGHFAGCLEVVKEYSADIAAAWEVVEHILVYDRRLLQFRAEVTRDYYFKYAKFVDCGDSSSPVYGAGTRSMPLSICRAALKVVSHALVT